MKNYKTNMFNFATQMLQNESVLHPFFSSVLTVTVQQSGSPITRFVDL